MPRTARLARLIGSASLLAAAGGCSTLRERFPRHEDVFKPVPLTIGQLRVEGTDSVYVLAGRGFELISPTRELLADAEKAVEAVGRTYLRYFESDPQPIVVRLRPITREMRDKERERAERQDAVARDSARRQALSGPRRDERGRRVLVVPVLMPDEEYARMGARPVFGLAELLVAQAWVEAYADAHPLASGGGDAAAAVAPPGTAGSGRRNRLPDWFVAGTSRLLAPIPYQEFMLSRLADRQKDLIPLRTLFDSAHYEATAAMRGPAPGEESGRMVEGPSGARQRVDRFDLFGAQSLAVAQFLAEREGPSFIAQLAPRLLRTTRPIDAFIEARTLPHDVDGIDGQFRSWLEEWMRRGRTMRRG